VIQSQLKLKKLKLEYFWRL